MCAVGVSDEGKFADQLIDPFQCANQLIRSRRFRHRGYHQAGFWNVQDACVETRLVDEPSIGSKNGHPSDAPELWYGRVLRRQYVLDLMARRIGRDRALLFEPDGEARYLV